MRGNTSIRSRLQRWQTLGGALGAAVLAATSVQLQAQSFTGIDVGDVAAGGTVVTNGNGTVAVSGSGSDIWGNADGFHYYFAPITGQYWDAVVRVHDLVGTDGWTKAELMVRQQDVANATTDPMADDPHISNMTTRSAGVNTIRGQHRFSRGGGSGERVSGATPTYPNQWLRVSRVGAVFNMYIGTDGTNWTQYTSYNTATDAAGGAFSDPVNVGVAVTAHNNDGNLATATISGLKITKLAGLFLGNATGFPNGFSVQAGNNGTSIVNPSSAVLTLNGATVPVTQTTTAGDFTTFTHRGALLGSGTTNTMVLTIRDTNGQVSSRTNTFVASQYLTLASTDALAAATVDKGVSGFKMRVHQVADTGIELPNSDTRTELQLGGGYGPNVATTTSYVNGFTVVPLINFNNRQNVDPTTVETNGNFGTDIAWPGISAEYTNNFAAEFYTVLEFPAAGVYGFIVNSDDGFKVTPIIAGQDVTAQTNAAGIFVGGRGSADTLFYVNVQAGGLYAFRLTYEQGGGGGDMEFINLTDTGVKVLVNSGSPGAIKAYAKGTAIAATPYFESATPGGPAEANNATVNIVLVNADSAVNTSTIQLRFDNNVVTPVLITSLGAGRTGITYNPGVMVASTAHTVSLTFQDAAGKTITKTWKFTVAGSITARMFALAINDGALGKLINSAEYKNNSPTTVSNAPTIELNDGSGGWGADYLGYFVPLETGNYTFYISADDNAQLWLSTDENPGNAVLIANEPSWSNYREWLTREAGSALDPSMKRSTPKALVAGKRYFIHALGSQGGGGGNLAVTWRGPSDPAIVGGEFAKSAGLTPLGGVAVGVTPTNVTVVQGRSFRLNGLAFAENATSTTYQWLRNGTPVADATDLNYINKSAAVNQSGTYTLRATVTPASGGANIVATSGPITVTVSADTNAPVPVAGAITRQDGTVQIGVSFGSDFIDRSTLVQGNFVLSGGTASNFRIVTNSFSTYLAVVMDVTGLAPGASGTVTVSGVKDIFGNATASTAAPFTLGAYRWAETGSPVAKGQVVPVGSNGFDVLSGGRAYWGNYDEIDMAYLARTNDFDVSTQIIEAEFSSRWARVGLSVRNDLNVGMARPATGDEISAASAYAEIHANPNGTLAMIWPDPNDPLQPIQPEANNQFESNQRLLTGTNTSGWQNGPGPGATPDYPNVWLRLKRTGTNIVSYRGTNGVDWIQMGTTSITPVQEVVFVGPAHGPEFGNVFAGINDEGHDPAMDRLVVAKYRNFGDTVLAQPRTTLMIHQANGAIHLSWTGTGTLESTTQVGVGAIWTSVPGVTGTTYTTTATGTARYFRIRQ